VADEKLTLELERPEFALVVAALENRSRMISRELAFRRERPGRFRSDNTKLLRDDVYRIAELIEKLKELTR